MFNPIIDFSALQRQHTALSHCSLVCLTFIEFLEKATRSKRPIKGLILNISFNRKKNQGSFFCCFTLETLPILAFTGTLFRCFIANVDSFDNITALLSVGLAMLTLYMFLTNSCVCSQDEFSFKYLLMQFFSYTVFCTCILTLLLLLTTSKSAVQYPEI